MKADLVTTTPDDDDRRRLSDQVRRLTTQEKRDRLTVVFARTARDFLEMAYLVASLIDDGVKPEELRVEWVDTLRRVACGQTLPEVMATFRSSLVERIGALPLPDQQSIIDARPLKLAIRTENGWDHRLVAFINATPKERDQLLDTKRHHLRTEAEQRVWLDGKRRRGTRDGAAVRAGVLEVDKDRDGAYCGKKFIPKADLRAALRILGG